MTTAELTKTLQELESEHGELEVVTRVPHDYWGSVDSKVHDFDVRVGIAQPDGPKSAKSIIAVVIDT